MITTQFLGATASTRGCGVKASHGADSLVIPYADGMSLQELHESAAQKLADMRGLSGSWHCIGYVDRTMVFVRSFEIEPVFTIQGD